MNIKRGVYKHYKDLLYQVISVARHSETLEEMVVYQALYGNYGIWVRPLDMFTGTVVIGGKQVPRFAYQSPGMTELPKID